MSQPLHELAMSQPLHDVAMSQPLHGVDRRLADASQLTAFARFVESRTGRSFSDYRELHAFSVEDVGRFWSLWLSFSGAIVDGDREPAREGDGVEGSRFFPKLRLSWAENLLAPVQGVDEDAVAVVAVDESGGREEISRAELRARVRSAAAGLEAFGVREGDHVAAVVRNTLDTLVACLAVTSRGATWSSVALDMGAPAAIARLSQLSPKVLVVHDSTVMNGARVTVPVDELAQALPGLEVVVRLGGTRPEAAVEPTHADGGRRQATLVELESLGRAKVAGSSEAPRRFAFDHPLFVLFSSGTTGAPKAIVHGHGGTLLEHLKEHRLHCDLGPRDTLCFHTSTGWMMWNWTVSALATGARVVLYDGSVSYPARDSLLTCAAREGVTVLGVSPAYLHYLVDAGVRDARELLRAVRLILATGSVMPRHLHEWAKEHLSAAPVESISGGTDILGCFVLGSPWSPTFAGECSSIGLGLDVRAWRDGGPAFTGAGELVCTSPFPSRPIRLLHDPDGARLHATYYAQHEGAWTHGDIVELTGRGTVRVLGRCDGVLNIRGIRIGPSEIYDVVGTLPEVTQSMAVDADDPGEPGGKRLVLFVVLRQGVRLERALTLRIKRALKERASAAHVPAVIVAVDELPTTFNHKLSEAAAQDALSNRPVRNLQALRNPGSVAAMVTALRGAEERAKAGASSTA